MMWHTKSHTHTITKEHSPLRFSHYTNTKLASVIEISHINDASILILFCNYRIKVCVHVYVCVCVCVREIVRQSNIEREVERGTRVCLREYV